MSVWVGTGSGSYYSTYVGSELCELTENGVSLTRVFSISACDSTTGSYFHDMPVELLYIHTTYDATPQNSDYYFQGKIWLGFCSRQNEDKPFGFIPQEAAVIGCDTDEIYYRPVLDQRGSNLSQGVAEFFTSTLKQQYGALKFLDPVWWWENRNTYVWESKKVVIKKGDINAPYSEFETLFVGKTNKPEFSDAGCTISLSDIREGAFKDIPVDRFDMVTYPNLDPDMENKVIPIAFGIKNNIKPVLIDSTTFTYKISQTVFSTGTTYKVDSSEIYKDGVQLFYPGDFTGTPAGEFTLTVDPGDAEITCNVHGLRIGYNLLTGAATGLFSENVADILFFVLTELNEIPISEIDLPSFLDLQTRRGQRLGTYLNESIKTIDFIRILQASAIFHLLPTADGKYMTRRYDRGVPEDIKKYDNYHYQPGGFKISPRLTSVFGSIVVEYDGDPTENTTKTVTADNNYAKYRYEKEDTLTVNTILTNQGEAEALLEFYAELVKEAPGMLSANIIGGEDIIPTDKVAFSRDITADSGDSITILNEEIYVILELRKNIVTGTTAIVAVPDVQARGQTVYTDIPHVDEHEDYTDHTDVAHEDSYTDISHGDHDDHADSHADEHGDVPHTDHSDFHGDSHQDHDDAPYIDVHADTYLDHTDSSTYVDTHEDVAHQDYTDYNDSVHTDLHLDGHTDHDDHVDQYEDIPYTDSEI